MNRSTLTILALAAVWGICVLCLSCGDAAPFKDKRSEMVKVEKYGDQYGIPADTSEELKPYVALFYKDAHDTDTLVWRNLQSIRFGEVRWQGAPADVIGVCASGTVTTNVITGEKEQDPRDIRILQSWWANAGEWEKRNLIHHELGHCALNKDHISGAHIMNPFILPELILSTQWNILMMDLFAKGS